MIDKEKELVKALKNISKSINDDKSIILDSDILEPELLKLVNNFRIDYGN